MNPTTKSSAMPSCPKRAIAAGPILAAVLVGFGWLPEPITAAPPVPAICDQQDHGARVKCKYGNVLMQQQATADMIMTMQEFPQTRKQELMEQTARAMREESRVGAADFKMLTKKRNPKCQIVEKDNGRGNGDGICDPGPEDCVEVIGDGIGDDDGICKPLNGKKREVCVEICDDEALALEPDNFDEGGRGMDTEMQLDLLTEQYMEGNEMLEDEMSARNRIPRRARIRARVQALAQASADPCQFEKRAGLPGAVVDGFKIVKDSTEIIKNMADKFCELDASGFNAAFLCILPAAVFGAVEITTDMMEFDSDIKQNEVVDYSFACLHEVEGAVGENNAALDEIEMDLAELDSSMSDLRDRIAALKALVQTPLGQR